MKKGRGSTALALTLALALTMAPARAAEKDGGLLLPAVNAYTGFRDVAEGDWFYGGVKTCYEAGLMNGTGDGEFTPEGVMTVAEAAAIAARLREISTGEAIPSVTPRLGETLPWYQSYVGYLAANGVAVGEPEKAATRSEFFGLLAAVTPKDLLAPINSIDALPDVDAGDPVLEFYNAGILTGVDENGTFAGDKTLTRAECAVMTARLADPAQRKVGVVPPSVGRIGVDDEIVMTVDGVPVYAVLVADCMNNLVYYNDYNIYQNTGKRLDWNADYGVEDLKAFFREAARDEAVRIILENAKTAELGCSAEELPEKVVPVPERAVLEQYAQARDLLCAKHILVPDTETAQAVLDGLKAVPTLDQFNALLTVFGTDPGMSANPNGYLFTAGEMVPEFETGVRALDFGAYSAEPVQSDYGYHIIWRLDPADHPDLLDAYRQAAYASLLEGWLKQADVRITDQATLDAMDPQARYEQFLTSLSKGN